MQTQTIFAVLRDESGNVLLVRRQTSALWTLPGGEVRTPVATIAFLTACCRRQVGMAPDFVAPIQTVHFAGKTALVATEDVPRERARACGRIEATRWVSPAALPQELTPLARMAIALRTLQPVPARSATPLAFAC